MSEDLQTDLNKINEMWIGSVDRKVDMALTGVGVLVALVAILVPLVIIATVRNRPGKGTPA